MEYTIRQLADLAGISTRTLRYYDETGLLHPSRVSDSGYRYYGEKEVSLLQQILFYRERDLGLEVIQKIIHQPDFDVEKALEEHLEALLAKQEHILSLIQTVKLTLADRKGEYVMDDKMKFEAFKKKTVEENEKTYGKEARERYGDQAVDESNRKLLGMTEADYERFKDMEHEVLRQLEEAVKNGSSPESETGKRIVLLHKNWLGFTWKEYSANAHKGLAEMYLADERFQAYYDRNVAGCAKFLVEAVRSWA
ncbi:MAG: MerR family transcriptional regulator [Clostridiales bacterium]|nr:MerR family transcriptional regulator [Clostridiales bacterium]